MNRMSKVLVAVGGLLCLLATPAVNAQITSYSDLTSWEAASGFVYGSWNSQMETFEQGTTLDPGLSIIGPNVQIGVVGTGNFSGWLPDPNHVLHDMVTPGPAGATTTIAWDTPVTAMGAFWDLAGPGGPGRNITLTMVDGTTVTTLLDALPNTLEGNGLSFRGFVSDTAFTSVILSAGSAPGVAETYEMDLLKSVSAVPEPESYAMMLAGLGLMGFLARRRKQNAMG